MRNEYDLSKAKRGPAVRFPNGNTRITIRLDDDVIAWFKRQFKAPSADTRSITPQ
jgi:uncharacterized protein (DUF4415 family)